MGRYFQHRTFPDVAFELPAALTEVPESPVAFHASGGPYLIGWTLPGSNTSGAAFAITVRPRLDGVALVAAGHAETIPIGANFTVRGGRLVEIEAGPHTLSLEASGTGTAGETLSAQAGVIWAIELNTQEASDRIE